MPNKPKNQQSEKPNESQKRDNFHTLKDAGNDLLAKYSTSQFHSMWLTRHFNIGEKEILVPLTNEQKLDII